MFTSIRKEWQRNTGRMTLAVFCTCKINAKHSTGPEGGYYLELMSGIGLYTYNREVRHHRTHLKLYCHTCTYVEKRVPFDLYKSIKLAFKFSLYSLNVNDRLLYWKGERVYTNALKHLNIIDSIGNHIPFKGVLSFLYGSVCVT